MDFWFFILMGVAMALALGSLVLGVFVMARGNGLKDARRSNRLMQWRLYMQGLALVLFILGMFVRGRL